VINTKKGQMNTNRTKQTIPLAVLAAIDHVRSIHPEVDMVVFNTHGHHCYMDEWFEAPAFTGVYDDDILRLASSASYEAVGHPAIFQAYTSEDA